MTKVWIVSALVVAAVVAGILLLTNDAAMGGGNGAATGRPPVPLNDAEVRKYKRVQADILRIIDAATREFIETGTSAGRARVETLLRRNKLDPDMWETLRNRVEFVVDVIRWEQSSAERTADMERRIQKARDLLAAARSEAMKTKHRRDIAILERQRDARVRPINDSDRAVVKKHWNDLDRLVPRIRTGK